MSAGTPSGAERPVRGRSWRARLRAAIPWLLLVAGLTIIGALLQGGGDEEGIPLDPASAGPEGTKGLVEVLRELGAEVTVSNDVPGPDVRAALVLADRLDEPAREELRAWVRSGGILLVADPSSPISPVSAAGLAGGGIVAQPLERDCDLPAFSRIPEVSTPDGLVFKVGAGSTGCYRSGDGAWILVQPMSEGAVVRMGGAATLLNAELGYDEAAAEAAAVPAAVLAPTPGSRVQVIWPASRGNAVPTNAEAPDLIDLLPNGVRAAMWQLAAAFVLLALWLGRRVGRPVAEPQPVELPASELVVSVGNLLQRARRRDQAAATLAEEARRILAERLGLPASSSAELVADTVAARTGIDRGRVLEALATTTGISDKDLVSRSQTIEEIRREVTRVR